MWKDDMKIALEKYMSSKSADASYCWFRNKYQNRILSLNLIDHLNSEEKRRRKNI